MYKVKDLYAICDQSMVFHILPDKIYNTESLY